MLRLLGLFLSLCVWVPVLFGQAIVLLFCLIFAPRDTFKHFIK
ncbi:hypothetical protein [Siphonobacter sp. SORGH_AS_1065]|nr:hypothetical protein [Siphonobacter sp. SORGH_AS_1065]MDQ1089013.1 hypothetical protein [Siphonobacter sp. SORGH_AS_1065]